MASGGFSSPKTAPLNVTSGTFGTFGYFLGTSGVLVTVFGDMCFLIDTDRVARCAVASGGFSSPKTTP